MERKEVEIEQTSIEIIDGDRGKNYPKNNELTSSGYCLFLSAANVTKSGLQFINNSFITKEKDALLRKGKLFLNDIVLTTRGTVGNVGLYSDDVPFKNMRINSGMVIIRPGKDFDTMFLYQYLRSCYFKAQITQYQSGSAQPQLPISTLQKMKVIKPNIAAQRRIASILSSLDRKIELNNKINVDLEEMAQAIFKNWFVDFEPFKDGKFVDSELGMIPEGWKVGTLGEFCKCLLGGTPSRSKEEYWNGEINWINSGEINKFRILEASEKITELGLAKSATKLLPKKTTVLAITGATLGQVSLLEIDSCANQSVIGVLENAEVPYEYIYPFIKDRIEMLIQHQTGGAQQHINKDNVESLIFLFPTKNVLKDYISLVRPMYKRIESLCFENLYLSLLRDTLLPRLMSGEIEILE